MNRLDRARFIRDTLIERPPAEWEWTQLGKGRFPALEWNAVNAVLWYHPRLAPLDPEFTEHPRLKTKGAIEPFMLDVWVSGAFVLSLAWNEVDALRIQLMNRGTWESEVFGLPLPRPLRGVTLH